MKWCPALNGQWTPDARGPGHMRILRAPIDRRTRSADAGKCVLVAINGDIEYASDAKSSWVIQHMAAATCVRPGTAPMKAAKGLTVFARYQRLGNAMLRSVPTKYITVLHLFTIPRMCLIAISLLMISIMSGCFAWILTHLTASQLSLVK